MKKIFLFLLMFSALNQNAFSQNTFGLKAGLNLSKQEKSFTMFQNSPQSQETKPLLGFQFGFFYKIKMNRNWTFSTESNFSLIGSRTKYLTEQQILNPDGKTHYYKDKIGYIEVPLTIQLNFCKLYLGMGPGIGIKAFSKITEFENKTYNTSYYKAIDASGNFLAGYKLSKKCDINLRYSCGWLDVHEDNNEKIKNHFLNFSILYSLK